MKKSLLILLMPFSAFCQDVDAPLVDTNQAVTVQLGVYSGTTLNTSDVITTLSDVPYRFFTSPVAVRIADRDGVLSISIPSLSLSNTLGLKPGALSYTQRPVKDNVNGLAYPYKYFPKLQALYRFIESCYISGIAPSAFDEQSRSSGSTIQIYLNVDIPTMFAQCLSSTNGIYRSQVIDLLSSIRNSSSAASAHLDDISNSLVDLASSYEKVNFFDFGSFDSVVDFASSSGYISPSHAQSLKDTYNSLSVNPTSRQNFEQSTRQLLSAASRTFNALDSLLSNDLVSDVGQKLNQSLNDSINAGFSGSAHIHGATTNLLQRITNNTEQIKNDLQAWRVDTTNRLDRQWDGIKNIRDNTGSTAANVSSIVNNGVKISGPVQFTLGTDFLGVELNAGDITELIQGFADGADSAMQKWLREWDLFKDSQLPYMSRFSSFIESNTNLLSSIDSKLELSFTNVFDTIYSALTNFDFAASTNSYMLLSDYSDYINTSGLSDLLSVLDDDSYSDFKDELSTIGAYDVSAGYGRWWRYYTGLSTIQANSVFNIANLLLDHEKLLKDLKRENPDVVELSDANVFSELLSKIPSQTHIDNKISELTNSIDQTGFARIRELIPDLTNRLSVASALYDHDFALPTDISWVLIPADSDLNIKERVVHISPSEHYRVFQVLHYGIAFSYCIVNLILLPKFLLLLVRLFDRVWNKSEHLIYNSTQS